MTEKFPDKGKCFYCGKDYSKRGMTSHIKSCKAREENITEYQSKSKGKETDIFHIIVEGYYNPQYWLHLEVPASKKLTDLDGFLRDIWLECCGHLSRFDIDDVSYSVSPMTDFDEKTMSAKVGTVLDVGTEFTHEYDYGSTTHLSLRVVDKRKGIPHRSIDVMGRNFPPPYICQTCNKRPATWIDLYTDDYEKQLFCRECTGVEHEDDLYDEYMPLVNSPRAGVCGYMGPEGKDKYAT